MLSLFCAPEIPHLVIHSMFILNCATSSFNHISNTINTIIELNINNISKISYLSSLIFCKNWVLCQCSGSCGLYQGCGIWFVVVEGIIGFDQRFIWCACYFITAQEIAGYIMVMVFCLSLLKVYRDLLGGLVVLLGLVNGLSGLPRFFISVQDFLGCIRVAEFCSV